ncbi:hypothetical protein [Spirosoma areae]
MTDDELIARIQAIANSEDMACVSALIREQPGKMAPAVQDALLDKLSELTDKSEAARQDAISVLKVHGVEYPLTDWLTPANYARSFHIANVATVTNWINRGIIPADNVKEIPELGLRLVKAVEYSPRPYTAPAGEEKDAA